MKLTVSQLRKIIKEEVAKTLAEAPKSPLAIHLKFKSVGNAQADAVAAALSAKGLTPFMEDPDGTEVEVYVLPELKNVAMTAAKEADEGVQFM
jgi:hypothetical protein